MKRLQIDYNLGSMDALVSLSRYSFVTRLIHNSNSKVLDFGCGSGYGINILKEKYNDVTGFDTYPDKFVQDKIKVHSDLNNLPDNAFDIITCFEVIEHLNEKDQINLMDILHACMNDNGSLFISTVRKIDPPPTENRRIEHVRELSFEELLDYCNNKFSTVYTFGQIDQHITTFYPDNHYHFVFICTNKR